MKKGEIWIIELPFKNGREQSGTRPCIIISDTKTDMVIVIPLTSNIQALRFPNTLEIKKSLENNLEKDSIALIFHIQSLDKKRFINKVGILEDHYLKKIDELLKKLIEL